eukprot:s4583_g5.t13
MERELLLRRLRNENVGEWGLRATLELCFRCAERLTKIDDVLEVLHACRKLGSWELALKFWSRFQRELPHASTANVCIAACGENEAWSHSVVVFDAMMSTGVEPDISSHNAIANVCSRILEVGWHHAIQILKEGESNLLDLDCVSLNTLAGMLDWSFSIACVSRMCYLGLVSWTSATAAAARSKGWSRATTIARAGAQHIKATTSSAPCAAASVPGFVRHGRWEDAVLIAGEICRTGDDVSDAVLNGAISACADGRRWNVALAVAAHSTSRQLQPSLITVNTVLSSCCGSSVWDGAVGWLHMARCWDVFTYSAWISSYTAAALWQAALRTLALARHAAVVSVASQTAGLSAFGCARQWRRMLGLLAASGMQPAASMAPECVNAALQGCFDSRRWPVSLDLLKVSQMLRIDIHQTGLACLIRTCGGALLWVAAMDLLEAGGPWPPAAGDQTWNAKCWAEECSYQETGPSLPEANDEGCGSNRWSRVVLVIAFARGKKRQRGFWR